MISEKINLDLDLIEDTYINKNLDCSSSKNSTLKNF